MIGKKVCPWCGLTGGTTIASDAANIRHCFHAGCWKEHCDWLRKFGKKPVEEVNDDGG